MFTNRCFFAFISVFFAAILYTMFAFPDQASATHKPETISNSCISCHEDLYYLHDTGKNYCVTEMEERCVNCHAGNSTVMDEEKAHAGLIASPQKENGTRCQECHTQDAQDRLATFASKGGYKEVIEVISYAPTNKITVGFPELHEPNPIVEGLPWIAGGLLLFSLWLILVLWPHN